MWDYIFIRHGHKIGGDNEHLSIMGGRRIAEMGKDLEKRGLVPDLIVASDGIDTKETAKFLAESFTVKPPIVIRCLREVVDGKGLRDSVTKGVEEAKLSVDAVRRVAIVCNQPMLGEMAEGIRTLEGDINRGQAVVLKDENILELERRPGDELSSKLESKMTVCAL